MAKSICLLQAVSFQTYHYLRWWFRKQEEGQVNMRG